MLTVYIQKVKITDHENKIIEEFADDWVYAAWLGFHKLGCKIIYFEEINEVPKIRNEAPHVVISDFKDLISYFIRCQISVPPLLNIPHILKDFAKRKWDIKTLGEFKKETELPIFVKSVSEIKAFPSGVIKEKDSRNLLFYGLDENMTVMTSEVLDIVSEYRCFVHKGELVGMKHYQGSFEFIPIIPFIKRAIKTFIYAPIAYTLDIGITNTGENVLIEAQDFWAIGNYGFDEKKYAMMLWDRFFEIIKQN